MSRRGVSYRKRVEEVNRIYDNHVKRGLPNREIWRRYVYPLYGISERTFYNMLNACSDAKNHLADADVRQLLLFSEDTLKAMEEYNGREGRHVGGNTPHFERYKD